MIMKSSIRSHDHSEQLELMLHMPTPRDRASKLEKLLEQGARSIYALVQITGWRPEAIQQALLQLIVDGKVKCLNGSDRLMYALREPSGLKIVQS
jgi:predicted Rossmann fold nucleotide-binding protein DprA/Smf involved in DNA uptake